MRNGGCKFSCCLLWYLLHLEWLPSMATIFTQNLVGSMWSILGEYPFFCYFVLYHDADEVQFFSLMVSFAWCRIICMWHETDKNCKTFLFNKRPRHYTKMLCSSPASYCKNQPLCISCRSYLRRINKDW
jgi:hypothetical protein